MFDTLTLQKQLVAAAMPSGFESGVGALLAELAAPYADEVMTDALGNVICHKKGEGKRIMLAAHMDLIGFMVTYIDEKGYLRFEPIGGHTPAFLHRTPIRFKNGTKGVVMCEKWAEESKKKMSDVRTTNFYIDIGATNKEEGESMVKVGDLAMFDTKPQLIGDDCMMTCYADDLASCCVQLMAMEQLKESKNDLYFVFTVQEEVGCKGALTAAAAIEPHMGIAIDLCYSGRYTHKEMRKQITGEAGLVAYLNENDVRKIEKRILAGDEKAKEVYDAMLYQTAKQIAASAAVLCGKVDAVLLTGGIANSRYAISEIEKRVTFIATEIAYPGELEMQSLGMTAYRVLTGKEEIREVEKD